MSLYQDAIQARRSIYALGPQSPLSDAEVFKILGDCLKHCPTAFHSQTGRILHLTSRGHERFWRMVEDALKAMLPAEQFEKSQAKIGSFAKAQGTLLFFEEEASVQALQERFPLYAEHFPKWSLQASGMLQYMVWTALAAKDVGASLQHYGPLVDTAVREAWKVPDSWKLMAQMPYGAIEAQADKKEFMPLEERLFAHKS